MALDMRAKLGESVASVQKFDIQADATTSSLEALKTYAIGIKTLHAHGTSDAVPFFKRAIELDSQFAKAYDALGAMYSNLGETELAAQNATQAYRLRDRVSEVEKYGILAAYFSFATGDLEKSISIYDTWIGVYPRDPVPANNRAISYWTLGSYERALAGFQSSQSLNADFVYLYRNMAYAYIALNRIQDAKSALGGMQQHGYEPEIAWDSFYTIAFLDNDLEGMKHELNIGLNRPQSRADAFLLGARTEAYHGRLSEARDWARKAANLQAAAGPQEVVSRNHATVALEEAEFGNWTAAKKEAISALPWAGRVSKAQAALAMAEIGQATYAREIVAKLEKAYPSDTILTHYWLPTIEAAIQIRQGNARGAVVTLEPSEEYELGSVFQRQGPLYPTYMRGLAYLSLRDGPKAAAEFQKILDHPGIVFNDPIGALAHLQLGRACGLFAEEQRTKAAYQKFLSLWKDADPDIPILKQAKAEYAKLQ